MALFLNSVIFMSQSCMTIAFDVQFEVDLRDKNVELGGIRYFQVLDAKKNLK